MQPYWINGELNIYTEDNIFLIGFILKVKQLMELYGIFPNAWTIVQFWSFNSLFNEILHGRFSKYNPHFLQYLRIQNSSLFTKSYCPAFFPQWILMLSVKLIPQKWFILSKVYYEVLFPSTHVLNELNKCLGFRKSFQHDAIMTHKMFFAHFSCFQNITLILKTQFRAKYGLD